MRISLSNVTAMLPRRSGPLFTIPFLEIPFGSRVLIEGPSGKGKTTLLHLLAGQFLPNAGSIRLGDQELTALDGDARCRIRRKHIGIIFQRFNLMGHLSALENVYLGQTDFSSASVANCRKALEDMGLGLQANQRSASLSPGEQQRVAVARILASPPDIILADEPTSSLDEPNTQKVMTALCEASIGRTLIVVSHDQRIRPFFEKVLDFTAWAGE